MEDQGSNNTADAFPSLGDWREAIVSVSDLDVWLAFWRELAGYELRYRGRVSAECLAAWRLPGSTVAEEALLASPGYGYGMVRLVRFDGLPQQQIRSSAQVWETGGWFDLNLRVRDMQDLFGRMQALGWQGRADPMELTAGPITVREWLAHGPDGVVIALVERLDPPLPEWSWAGDVSHVFNATQIIADAPASIGFYEDVLGFEPFLVADDRTAAPGPNVFGLPHEIAVGIPRSIRLLRPRGAASSSIELVSVQGASGREFASLAVPPNLGIIGLRFPVRDAGSLARALDARGIEIVTPPTRLVREPAGPETLLIVRGPGGEWLEFVETSGR